MDEQFAAHLTAVGLVACMGLQMLLHVCLGGEAFGAHLADKGLVGHMQLFELPQPALI